MSDPGCTVEPNPDVSGIGVRVSFYLQSYFLALLSARSSKASDVAGSLTTLVVTNMAYAVTTLVLGFVSTSNQLSLYDAMVVLYLLIPSWTAIFFTLPTYNRNRKSSKSVKWLTVLQSYLIFATGFAVLGCADSFGADPDCSDALRFVAFRPFHVIDAGRIVYLALLAVVTAAYTMSLFIDYRGWLTLRKYEKILAAKFARKAAILMRLAHRRNQAVNNTDVGPMTNPGSDGDAPPNQPTPIVVVEPASEALRGSRASLDISISNGDAASELLSPPGPTRSRGRSRRIYTASSLSSRAGASSSHSRHDRSMPDLSNDLTANSHNTNATTSPSGAKSNRNKPREDPLQDDSGSTTTHSFAKTEWPEYKANVDGGLMVHMFFVTGISSLAILNTELLRVYNHPLGGDGSWGFGQILPLFLVVPTVWSTITAFSEHGFGVAKRKRRTRAKEPHSLSNSHRVPDSYSASHNDEDSRHPPPAFRSRARPPFGATSRSSTSQFMQGLVREDMLDGIHSDSSGRTTRYESGAMIEEIELDPRIHDQAPGVGDPISQPRRGGEDAHDDHVSPATHTTNDAERDIGSDGESDAEAAGAGGRKTTDQNV